MLMVSMIQAMIWASVPISGAGMSSLGPMMMLISVAYRRVRLAGPRAESGLGFTRTPPLAPPLGMLTTALLHLIHTSNPPTASSDTFGLASMALFAAPGP